jgi:predicted metalloprotease with PDZ domain
MLDDSMHGQGTVQDVLWDGPAFKAGVGPGMKLVAVNGRAYDADKLVLQDAIAAAAAKGAKAPIRLLLRDQDRYLSFDVDYHGGLKYPVLMPVAGKTLVLDSIIAAH